MCDELIHSSLPSNRLPSLWPTCAQMMSSWTFSHSSITLKILFLAPPSLPGESLPIKSGHTTLITTHCSDGKTGLLCGVLQRQIRGEEWMDVSCLIIQFMSASLRSNQLLQSSLGAADTRLFGSLCSLLSLSSHDKGSSLEPCGPCPPSYGKRSVTSEWVSGCKGEWL